MDERPPWGFWIAGTIFMLLMTGAALLPIILLAGGKPAFGIMFGIIFLLYDSAPTIAGALAAAGVILLVVRLVNRRRATP